jgi:hypothetical protein
LGHGCTAWGHSTTSTYTCTAAASGIATTRRHGAARTAARTSRSSRPSGPAWAPTSGFARGLAHGVGQNRPNTHRAPIHIQQRVDSFNPGFEGPARKGIQSQLNRLLQSHFALEPLRQAEIDIHAAGVFQVDQVSPVLDVIAHIHHPDTDGGIKRRKNGHARKACTRQRQLGLDHLQIGGTLFQNPLCHKILRDQFLVALVIGLGNGNLRLRLFDFGALQHIVQLDQDLAFAYPLAIGKPQLLDSTSHLGAKHHALARAQGANRLGIVLQLHFFNLRHLYPGRPHHRSRSRACWRTGTAARRGRWVSPGRSTRSTTHLGRRFGF